MNYLNKIKISYNKKYNLLHKKIKSCMKNWIVLMINQYKTLLKLMIFLYSKLINIKNLKRLRKK